MVPETTPDATHRVVETERITDRLQRLYKWFFFLAALLGVLAVNALTFPEFHPAQNAPAQLSHGLLCSALVTSIISAVILLMLLFEFDETASPPRSGLHVASVWTPVVLLDMACVELLVGIASWYCSSSPRWAGEMLAGYLVVLLCVCIALSLSIACNWSVMNKTYVRKGD
ncbi:hypothetical protein PENSUB_4589 [Penicillium subrubescens]|uniref:Uncharacterized protein n=1 Tax=Penicillium subrubescens TaxID=1316194 RepID=A0A1Q5UC08_9EURO|nr:hypothetical protein PENSUB_4589 [Penicillium subrubescens]